MEKSAFDQQTYDKFLYNFAVQNFFPTVNVLVEYEAEREKRNFLSAHEMFFRTWNQQNSESEKHIAFTRFSAEVHRYSLFIVEHTHMYISMLCTEFSP